MATKSYKLQLDLRPWADKPVDEDRFTSRLEEIRSTRKWLDDTREAFNVGVDYLTRWLLRMHRGPGVFREKKDGIWREWHEISTLEELKQARDRLCLCAESGTFALLENRELLDVFKSKGKSEAEAVELAECCRRIAKELCPPSEDANGTQMPRDDLDLLTLSTSTAKGIRERGLSKSGEVKEKSGRRPQWILKQAISELVGCAPSWESFKEAIGKTPQFVSAESDGKKLIEKWEEKYESFAAENGNRAWDLTKASLADYCKSWEEEKRKAEARKAESATSGSIAAYKRLLQADCLPLPGFERPAEHLRLTRTLSEWNYAMWNMAGQRTRSHLGWVHRRTNERVVWESQTALFERGGWMRVKREGKPTKEGGLTPDDIRFVDPLEEQNGDFKKQPAYGERKWAKVLRQYESVEMPKHLQGMAFGAAEEPRVRKRTAKGRLEVRDRWIDLIDKAKKADRPAPSANELMAALNEMRAREPRNFGDQRLFEWLAAPERRWLWDGNADGENNDCGRQDRDCVSAFVTQNEHLADKPASITFTRSDPVKHPVWPFFGENSAVEYWLRREKASSGQERLVLVLRQLLSLQADDSYAAVDQVKIALRGYDDFESSFALANSDADVSAKQELVFRDDLLGGETRPGTLSGMKLTWERDELEAANRKRHPSKRAPRIYANFSCDAGAGKLPQWLTEKVGYIDRKNPRDGMKGFFKLSSAIRFEGARRKSESEDTAKPGRFRPPGSWEWPKEAIENRLSVRGTDLGYRISSAAAWWQLSFEKLLDKAAWPAGVCENQPVFAVLERTDRVSLPGDGEPLPSAEQALRDRLYSVRTRLSLNNTLLRIVRLLTLDSVTSRVKTGEKFLRRSDGTRKPVGILWESEIKPLNADEMKENCWKAAEQLLRWAETDAMSESLKAIHHDGSVWDWLASREECLKRLRDLLPKTIVPTETDAKRQKLNRDALKAARDKEDADFAAAVYELRVPLAKALCGDYDVKRGQRAKSGLWAEFDRSLTREVSYGEDTRRIFEDGLLRLLRKPPVSKHRDRKDDANNLPHGKTHRGGLSMSRLNFLDDVKNFVRRWSCRPRWPGDVRRVPENAKFDRCDTEHLDNLREHRAKLISHADVAQTLGFEQDLRRGLWRFKAQSGELLWQRPERGHFYRRKGEDLVQCPTPSGISEEDARHPHPAFDKAHVLVYEDLTRYRMSSDRPKKENAGLARWSHRRILEFSLHVGELFGVPIATVDARFSSRFCSHCGAPGCRASRFDPDRLRSRWMQRVRASSDIRDAALKKIANEMDEKLKADASAYNRQESRPWVLLDGGTHFVCANSACALHAQPFNADENAAANIGLRFLGGFEGIRVTINGTGAVTKPVGYISPGIVLKPNDSDGIPFWIAVAGEAGQSRKKSAGKRDAPMTADSEEGEEEMGGEKCLFRDPSGKFLCAERWYSGKDFWTQVAAACAKGIHAANPSQSALA
jgi:hypothetical protein